jgi:hypothetical protein
MCNHLRRVGDNYGESCLDCGEQLRGFGYGGWFGARITGNEKCIHLYSPMGDGGPEVCVFCEDMKKEITESES